MFDRTGPRHDLAAAAAAGGNQTNTIKIAVAIVALIAAGVLLAWNFGLFSSGGKPPIKRTAQEQQQIDQEFQEQEQIRQELESDPETTLGGA